MSLDTICESEECHIVEQGILCTSLENVCLLDELTMKLLNIDLNKFENCTFEQLNEFDIVMSTTCTYSQKYMIDSHLEKNSLFRELNTTKYGILIKKNNAKHGQSIILHIEIIDGNVVMSETNFYYDPCNSGWVTIKKYVE
jgi:hypothetical protein